MEVCVTPEQEFVGVRTALKGLIVHLNHVQMIVLVMELVILKWGFVHVRNNGLKKMTALCKLA